ncbi:acetylglutamate kinase [Brevibacterium sp. 91QC2O2]|uniref:acetylglutamate kinase n=1 Tax=Brevibacterium TaxID=1696 RepID=UPI00211B763A|nr:MULTISPECIES: acetylglutamate kinase [unclassified Brevibacterium]MCQ9369310.1 acetylglutamate kinase [Brevibacterium sp. 91QC2O2]MCQ9385029.1 acetylglutamate kinase [Brevibacterium sp. 68QC2CO]
MNDTPRGSRAHQHLSPAQRLAVAQSKAEVLTEALPWIKTFKGATIVIKYGGNAMVSPELQQAFADDIAFFRFAGLRPIVVHGGGPQINTMLERLGIESEFIAGQRYTSEEAAEVVRMVLSGQVNRDIVARINMNGDAAVGLSGEDGDLLLATPSSVTVDGQQVALGRVGEIRRVNVELLNELLDAGRVPVVCSIAVELGGPAGKPLNINADLAAAQIAKYVGADKLIMLTDVPGLYRDWPDRDSLISRIAPEELRELLPRLDSGMIPKMTAALDAVDNGVGQAHIIDGRTAHSLLLEVFTDEGIGTLVQYPDFVPRSVG